MPSRSRTPRDAPRRSARAPVTDAPRVVISPSLYAPRWRRGGACLLLLAAVAAALPASAAGQVVRGRVVAGEATAVDSAAVLLLPAGEGDTLAARSGADGRFTLRPTAGGTYRLAAERRGFRRAVSPALTLRPGDSVEVVLHLRPDTALLNPLEVVATARRTAGQLEAFYRRAEARRFGWFLTRGEIERRRGFVTSDLLRTAPGLDVRAGRAMANAVRGRGGCVPAVYLDGMKIDARAIDLWTTPQALEGIEVYADGAGPAEYRATGCALVLLWTRV